MSLIIHSLTYNTKILNSKKILAVFATGTLVYLLSINNCAEVDNIKNQLNLELEFNE